MLSQDSQLENEQVPSYIVISSIKKLVNKFGNSNWKIGSGRLEEGNYLYLFETLLLKAARGQITANNTIIGRCLLKADSNDAAPGGLYMEG